MRDILKSAVSRRSVLGAGLAGASLLAMPAVLRAPAQTRKVGGYGGDVKETFGKNKLPHFNKATGIASIG